MHLLISGIPATGKTKFSKWLVENHGYFRCPQGEEPDASFYSCIDNALKYGFPNRSKVVIDWGFPVACISYVRELISKGVEPWWFDGDRDAARESFRERLGHPATENDFSRQIEEIKNHCDEIKDIFSDHVLTVIKPGPIYMCNEDRWLAINGNSSQQSWLATFHNILSLTIGSWDTSE